MSPRCTPRVQNERINARRRCRSDRRWGGRRLPIEAGKGYHVDVPSGDGDPEPPIWLHEDRVVITPLSGSVRFAGTMKVSDVNHDVSRRRVDAISAAVGRLLPILVSRPPAHVWRGLRPCTPDGLPVIGRPPAIENATLAAGHGMWGLQLAPVTAELVAQVIAGDDVGPDRFAGGIIGAFLAALVGALPGAVIALGASHIWGSRSRID